MGYDSGLGWGWLCSLTLCPWAVYWFSLILQFLFWREGKVTHLPQQFVTGIRERCGCEVPRTVPGTLQSICKWWLLLLVGLSHSVNVGGEDISTPPSHQLPFLWPGWRNAVAVAEAERLWLFCLHLPVVCPQLPFWMVAGHVQWGRLGGHTFPWCILVLFQLNRDLLGNLALAWVGWDYSDLRNRL